jgi:hypothetical protein
MKIRALSDASKAVTAPGNGGDVERQQETAAACGENSA